MVPSTTSTPVCQLCGRFFRSLNRLKSHLCVHSLLGACKLKTKRKWSYSDAS